MSHLGSKHHTHRVSTNIGAKSMMLASIMRNLQLFSILTGQEKYYIFSESETI